MERSAVRLGYLVKQLETLIRSHLDDICPRYGLSTMQYVALSVLALHPEMSSAQLAARSFVSAQSAHQMVTALERAGLIVRTPDVSNRRILRITLTDAGAECLASCDRAVRALEDTMLAGVGAAEATQLGASLGSCIANLRQSRSVAGAAAGRR